MSPSILLHNEFISYLPDWDISDTNGSLKLHFGCLVVG